MPDDKGGILFVLQQPPTNFWCPPGGGVEQGELSREAGAREVLEETGLVVECERLLWVMEAVGANANTKNFYRLDLWYLARVVERAASDGEQKWTYFIRHDAPDNVWLPPDFWDVVQRGFEGHDPGFGWRVPPD